MDAEIRQIGIVIPREPPAEVRRAVGGSSLWDARIEYIVQSEPADLAHAVRTARPYLGWPTSALPAHVLLRVVFDDKMRVRRTKEADEEVQTEGDAVEVIDVSAHERRRTPCSAAAPGPSCGSFFGLSACLPEKARV